MTKEERGGFITMIVVTAILAILFIFVAEPPRIKKLTMQMPDGSQKVFVGVSAHSSQGKAHYRTKDGKYHEFVGPYWLETITKEEFDNFGKAEFEGGK